MVRYSTGTWIPLHFRYSDPHWTNALIERLNAALIEKGHLDIRTGHSHSSSVGQLRIFWWIDLFVPPVPGEVIKPLPAHGYKRDEHQGAPVCVDQTNSEERDELAAGHQKEEHVHKVLELIEQNLKKKNQIKLFAEKLRNLGLFIMLRDHYVWSSHIR